MYDKHPPPKKFCDFLGGRSTVGVSTVQFFGLTREYIELGISVKRNGGGSVANISRATLRKRIEKDLMRQMKDKGIKGNYLTDLIQDYLALWDLKTDLIEDIKENGIKVSGMHGPKSNPSINDLHKTNDRMIKVLDALSLNVPVYEKTQPRKYTAQDLL